MVKKDFEQEFEEAVEIRKNINGVLRKTYNDMSLVFSALFQCDKSDLKKISDANYYKGGYPSENSPPKISTFIRNAGITAKYFHEIGRLDEINSYMRVYGFELTPVADELRYTKNFKSDKKIDKAIDFLKSHYGFEIKNEASDMIEWFLERTENLQREICESSDEIKDVLYPQVEVKSDVSKSGFIGAVNAKANLDIKREKNKDISSNLDKIMDKSEEFATTSELFKEIISG